MFLLGLFCGFWLWVIIGIAAEKIGRYEQRKRFRNYYERRTTTVADGPDKRVFGGK